MAGRKPRTPGSETGGVTPLRPRRDGRPKMGSGVHPDGSWEPQHPNQRRPFQPGHETRLEHGASRDSKHVIDAAQQYFDAVLEDPDMPPHVKSPAFKFALMAWARMQAQADLRYEHMIQMDLDTSGTPRKVNGKSYFELWMMTQRVAGNMLDKLGLTPVSYARIRRDLGLAQQSAEQALESLAGQGSAIVTARRAEIEGGTAQG